MTFQDFYTNTIRSFNLESNHQRLGQFFMNALWNYNEHLYSSVPEDVDCFYVDARFYNFLYWLENNWVDT